MKVSLSWLKDYVPVRMEPLALADALTMVGLEVEAVLDRFDKLNSVLVTRIETIEDHPASDALKICRVSTGDAQLSIVCGAPNVKAGILAPLALPGTQLEDGRILTESVIRGIPSKGMLCSEIELGLGASHDGIMILPESTNIGETIKAALNLADPVFEISITPNRPDCLSIIGIAREVAAIQKCRLSYPEITISDAGQDIHRQTSVKIEDADHCPRYAARLLDNITVGTSPFWLQDRLLSVGLRPINNIVDVTNYVLMEMGQPLHAFDFDRLSENRIIVRTAHPGEKFITLDEKEHSLEPDMLMICDGEKPVAVGGVMGGLNSEIELSSTRVLIESAYFNPVSIRKTARRLGLNTEASHRFERGIDPQGIPKALDRAAELMLRLGQGRLVSGRIDEYPLPSSTAPIQLSTVRTNRLLGTELSTDDIRKTLETIEFKTHSMDPENISVDPPSFRVDVSRPEDLMEEVARLWGYNKIPETTPAVPAQKRQSSPKIDLRDRLKYLMTAAGFWEAINYCFDSPLSADRLNLPPEDSRRSSVQILNPLIEDHSIMRTSQIPGLLGALHRNLSHRNRDLKLFEIGKIFIRRQAEELPDEIEMLSAIYTGARKPSHWHTRQEECDFFDIKGVLESLLSALGVEPVIFTAPTGNEYHFLRPGNAAELFCDGLSIGRVGELHPAVIEGFDIHQKAFCFELDLDRLISFVPEIRKSIPLPKYPAVERDATLIIEKATEASRILEAVRQLDNPLVESVHLFDVFEGNPIPEKKKSISFRITYRSPTQTLEDENINRIHRDITQTLVDIFKADLPA